MIAIAVQLTVLGSGSAGNSTLLSRHGRGVLIDVGLSCRQVTERLSRASAVPESIDAIVITHAHGDHTRGAALFSRRHGVPVYTTDKVRVDWGDVDLASWRPLRVGVTTPVAGLRFRPLSIPHDASETLAFRIDTDAGAIGFATDVGSVTSELIDQFRDCSVLVIESNHAAELLRISPYAASTRARIGSEHGHLSNEALAAFIRDHLGGTVQCVVLAHLSRVNNVPEIAEMTCREALSARGRDDIRVVVARQDQATPAIDLGALRRTGSRARLAAQTSLPFDRVAAAPPATGIRPRPRP